MGVYRGVAEGLAGAFRNGDRSRVQLQWAIRPSGEQCDTGRRWTLAHARARRTVAGPAESWQWHSQVVSRHKSVSYAAAMDLERGTSSRLGYDLICIARPPTSTLPRTDSIHASSPRFTRPRSDITRGAQALVAALSPPSTPAGSCSDTCTHSSLEETQHLHVKLRKKNIPSSVRTHGRALVLARPNVPTPTSDRPLASDFLSQWVAPRQTTRWPIDFLHVDLVVPCQTNPMYLSCSCPSLSRGKSGNEYHR